MGASTLTDMPTGTNLVQSNDTPLENIKWEKIFITAVELNAGSQAPPAAAAFSGSNDFPWARKMAQSDKLNYFWDIPEKVDLAYPIRFQVLFSSVTANYNANFLVKYTGLAKGDDVTSGTTALDTTIPVTTDGAASDEYKIRTSYVGEIAANTIDDDERMLPLYLTMTNNPGAADAVAIFGLRIWHVRKFQ